MRPHVADYPHIAFPKPLNRVLGIYTKNVQGPTVVCFCSMHGNEPSGMKAFSNVYDQLQKKNIFIAGQLIGISGNIRALHSHQRFMSKDLNRVWTQDNILAMLHDTDERTYAEAAEQKEIFDHIRKAIKYRQGPVYFIDLHTTSSESQPYISINDTLRNRNHALNFPLPIVLGLEEHLEGTILNYINQLGYVALGFEAGQHDDPASVANHEAIIWLALTFSGCLAKDNFPDFKTYQQRLARNIIDGRKVFEVRLRHPINDKDFFNMEPGYINFQKIHKGEVLARDVKGPIKAPENGRIFMPLYQQQGNDGFFIVRQIKFFWLKVSAFLRKIRFHRFLHLLPGVNNYQGMKNTLVVNTKIAKWYVRDFFHLMGFRMKRKEGTKTIFTKREFDVDTPN